MTEMTVTPEVRSGRNRLAAAVAGGHAVKHLYSSAMHAIVLPEIAVDMDLSGTQFGALSTASEVASGATTMGAGYLGDRFVKKAGLILAVSLGTIGASFFLLGTAHGFWVFFGLMLLAGMGPSLYHPPAISALSRKFPDRRGFAISLHGTGGSVGEVMGPLLAGALLTGSLVLLLTWRDLLIYSIIPILVFAVLVWGVMRGIPAQESGVQSARAYLSSLFGLFRRPGMPVLVAVMALRSMSQSAVVAFLPLYLRSDLDYEPLIVGLYLAGAQIAGIVVQPAMGLLSDRFGRKSVLIPSMTALGLLFIALKFVEPGIPLALTILAMGAFLYTLQSIFVATGIDVAQGESQSAVVSVVYAAGFFGTVSPVIAGVIVDNSSTGNAFIYAGIIALAVAMLLTALRLPRRAASRA